MERTDGFDSAVHDPANHLSPLCVFHREHHGVIGRKGIVTVVQNGIQENGVPRAPDPALGIEHALDPFGHFYALNIKRRDGEAGSMFELDIGLLTAPSCDRQKGLASAGRQTQRPLSVCASCGHGLSLVIHQLHGNPGKHISICEVGRIRAPPALSSFDNQTQIGDQDIPFDGPSVAVITNVAWVVAHLVPITPHIPTSFIRAEHIGVMCPRVRVFRDLSITWIAGIGGPETDFYMVNGSRGALDQLFQIDGVVLPMVGGRAAQLDPAVCNGTGHPPQP